MKYFVLKPKGEDIYAKASRAAMLEYARVINRDNPELAEDLEDWVREIIIPMMGAIGDSK
jgi:hypothetical protein